MILSSLRPWSIFEFPRMRKRGGRGKGRREGGRKRRREGKRGGEKSLFLEMCVDSGMWLFDWLTGERKKN